jgi:hypothetical protein
MGNKRSACSAAVQPRQRTPDALSGVNCGNWLKSKLSGSYPLWMYGGCTFVARNGLTPGT